MADGQRAGETHTHGHQPSAVWKVVKPACCTAPLHCSGCSPGSWISAWQPPVWADCCTAVQAFAGRASPGGCECQAMLRQRR